MAQERQIARNGGNDNQNNNGSNGYRSTDLRSSPMMAHLLDALERGIDVGHYGRLTFAIIARHFLDQEALVQLLAKQPGEDQAKAQALLMQVEERDYNPPKPERIHEWQHRQEFLICPNPNDPNACNVYRDLQFPDGIYDNIEDFWEERAEAITNLNW